MVMLNTNEQEKLMENSQLSSQVNSGSNVKKVICQMARKIILNKLNSLSIGQITIVDALGDKTFGDSNSSLKAKIIVRELSFYRYLLVDGTIGAGEAYMQGIWTTDNLTDVVRIFSVNMHASDAIEKGVASLFTPFKKIGHWLNRNNVAGSKRNISAHYDLGNEMYRLFLDPKMMYSSAIYPRPDTGLNEASTYKLKHICDKLNLTNEHHLLEIGTGWGGMAIFAAQYTGCKVTTTTISKAQFDYAVTAVKKAGLADKIKVVMLDYRVLTGQYDRLVSVEMIEAVGHQYYQQYFTKCASLLKADGLMLIQAITITDQRYQYYLNNVDFIQKYIFPGGCLPSIEHIAKHVSQSTDMVIRNLEDIGLHYAQTLADWRENFFSQIEAVKQLGYDEQFIKMWEFYLCYCEGGFRERTISTVQVVLAKPQNRSESTLAFNP